MNDALTANDRMTAERNETKYLIAPDQVDALSRALSQRLPRHHFGGQMEPWYFVTTVYFDTPSRHQYRAALENAESNLKMRAKEYAGGPDRSAASEHEQLLWLELKTKHGSRTRKERFAVPKRDVPTLFPDGQVTAEIFEGRLTGTMVDAEEQRVLRDLAAYCRGFAQPMRADCLVNYKRLPWQEEGGALRVTLDLGLAYYAASSEGWRLDRPLVRDALGTPRASESAGVIEIKSLARTPEWLLELLDEMGSAPRAFSKFEQASAAVHG